jgi:hypothetical protein
VHRAVKIVFQPAMGSAAGLTPATLPRASPNGGGAVVTATVDPGLDKARDTLEEGAGRNSRHRRCSDRVGYCAGTVVPPKKLNALGQLCYGMREWAALGCCCGCRVRSSAWCGGSCRAADRAQSPLETGPVATAGLFLFLTKLPSAATEVKIVAGILVTLRSRACRDRRR